MATIKVRYFAWRGGRPRWVPGPGARKAGFKGQDLKDDMGQWLGLERAIERANELNAELDQFRASGKRRAPKRAPRNVRTLNDLFKRWQASPKYLRLRPSSKQDYACKIEIIKAELKPDTPIVAIGPAIAHGFWETMYRERGHAMANALVAIIRAAFSYAERIEWRPKDSNPFRSMDLPKVPPRVVLWTPEEVLHCVETADAQELWSIGDATVIAVHSGQRQGDVLGLDDRLFQPDGINLCQSKRGALVNPPMTQPLSARIKEARQRKMAANRVGGTMVVCELTGKAWVADTFRHKFADVRAEAAKQMPSLADKHFQDFRDTAVTRLALAGCTLPEIGAITGHSQKTIHTIIAHYLALDSAMAKAAIGKLETWMAAEGIKL